MKLISDKDYYTIVRAGKAMKGVRHENSVVANAIRQVSLIGQRWARSVPSAPRTPSLFKDE